MSLRKICHSTITMLSIVVISCVVLSVAETAKILAVFPTPSISHQLPFRPITQELARRGHEVVVITTDPAFEKGKAPKNLKEINVHDISYDIWQSRFLQTSKDGKKSDQILQVRTVIDISFQIFIKQLEIPEIQQLIKNETFDLLLLEAFVRSTLFFTHLYKAPTVLISSFGGFFDNYELIGAASHPLLYPYSASQKLNNRSMWDKLMELHKYWYYSKLYADSEEDQNNALRRFAPDMPSLTMLKNNVDMFFINMHPIWDGNRPVPPSVIYMNGIHQRRKHNLTEDLMLFLNSSTYGVVYVSFGTNVKPSSIPAHKIQMLINVFSQLPYKFLWKWDLDVMPGKTDNIKIFKWLPQADLLKHPNIKAFVMQCGLQSIDEAITAGIPLVCVPMLGDQWYNAERMEQLKIGKTVELEYLNENDIREALVAVINDNSYRNNVARVHSLMSDQPEPALDRVIWWIEHLLRQGSGRHLRAPSANMTWRDYFELDLVIVLLLIALVLTSSVIIAVYCAVKWFYKQYLLLGRFKKLKTL